MKVIKCYRNRQLTMMKILYIIIRCNDPRISLQSVGKPQIFVASQRASMRTYSLKQ